MAQRGRPTKPTALKVLEGNPGKRPLPENEPKPKPITPECPEWMADEGKALWHKLMPELERLGLMTIVDGTAFEAVCQNYAIWVECEKILQETGRTFETDNGYLAPRPEVNIGNKALKAVHTFMTEFGLTPAARVKLGTKPTSDEVDPMEAILRRVGG